MTIDWDYYGTFLEGLDCSDEEKRELIEVLWNIMVAFVDLRFGIHPAQLVANKACELNSENNPNIAEAVVKYLESSTNKPE
ncbi:MAG: hypothetical protein OIF58_01320 [Cohaesibacter sp.]|nr:hypothetical protein [Cohaesibacter sp.]